LAAVDDVLGAIVMGLIRKSLMIGTLGVVSGSSKKQKVARDTRRAAESTAWAMNQQHRHSVLSSDQEQDRYWQLQGWEAAHGRFSEQPFSPRALEMASVGWERATALRHLESTGN
jgi:hypothetical protein